MKRKRIGLMAVIIAGIQFSSIGQGATLVSLTVDQWQSPYPFLWVNQTQSGLGFTPGQEYAGLFSGLVDGQRWVFLCAELNVNIYVGQTYTFTMNSVADAPF